MLKKFSLVQGALLSTLALPVMALAAGTQTSVNASYITGLLQAVRSILDTLVPLLIALAVVLFFFYIVKYIWGGAEDKDASKKGIIWSIIAIAIMMSIWGLVGLLQNITGVGSATIAVPTLPR